jgi:hypothetical protein
MPRILSEDEIRKGRLKGEFKGLKRVKKPKPKPKTPDPTVMALQKVTDGIEKMIEVNGRTVALMVTKFNDMSTNRRDGPTALDVEVTQRDNEGFIKKVHIKRI